MRKLFVSTLLSVSISCFGSVSKEETMTVKFGIHKANLSNLSEAEIRMIEKTANEEGVPQSILFNVIEVESSFNPKATNGRCYGYCGLSKNVIQRYSRLYHLSGRNPSHNVIIGAKYLKTLHNYWIMKGQPDTLAWIFALADYRRGNEWRRVYKKTHHGANKLMMRYSAIKDIMSYHLADTCPTSPT
jgi:soluble lytic murein transglycosylase-like protein